MDTFVHPPIVDYRLSITDFVKQTSDCRQVLITYYGLWKTTIIISSVIVLQIDRHGADRKTDRRHRYTATDGQAGMQTGTTGLQSDTTGRQIDRQADKQTDRQRQKDRQASSQADRQADTLQACRQARQAGRQAGRQARLAGRQTG